MDTAKEQAARKALDDYIAADKVVEDAVAQMAAAQTAKQAHDNAVIARTTAKTALDRIFNG